MCLHGVFGSTGLIMFHVREDISYYWTCYVSLWYGCIRSALVTAEVSSEVLSRALIRGLLHVVVWKELGEG